MRNVYTLTFAVFVSFSGFVAYAQPGGPGTSIEAVIQSLTTVGETPGVSVSDVVQNVAGQLMDTSAPVEQQVSAIDGPLVVDTVIPEVNLTVVETIDTRTGRYPPRLKIDFGEFPLRSLTGTVPNNGRNVQTSTPIEMIAQRIKNRLRVPEFHITIEDRTAIISGITETEHQRKLIESMLRFEPGISKIQNNITIAP